MEPTEADLEAMGKPVRELLAREYSESDQIRQARSAFLESVARRNAGRAVAGGRSKRQRWLPLAIAAALGAGATALWLWPNPVSFEVGEAHAGHLGELIVSLDTQPTPLRFSEGSHLILHEHGRMRVLALAPENARVLVETGVLDVSIAHAQGRKRRWDFEAGPYLVTVTGTKFRMAFSPRDQAFSLSTQEGSVLVTGGCQPTARKVSAGESIDLRCPAAAGAVEQDRLQDRLQGSLQDRLQDRLHDRLQDRLQEPAGEAPPQPRASAPARDVHPVLAESNRGEPAWRRLLASGSLLEGLHAADRAGFERVCQLATAKELLGLADAARLFGSYARAVAALRILRQRFPGTADAATAAFRLGLIAFDREQAYAEAGRWFEIYLRDMPSGPFMGDSFGRLMEARARAGDPAGARTVAQQYLHRFPEGPYASKARGILSR